VPNDVALPGLPVPVFAVSASILPMSAGQDAAKAFGQHTALLLRSRLAGGPQGKRTRLGEVSARSPVAPGATL
jgi:hypothetical protein